MSFYEELMAANSQDNMDKTASVKGSIDLRKELEDAGMAASEMEVLAKSILGFMSKKADEVQDDNLADVVDQEDPAVAAADAVSADDQVKADAADAAIASAKASIDDAASAIDTLEAVTTEDPGEAIPAEEPIDVISDDTADNTSDDNQVIASEYFDEEHLAAFKEYGRVMEEGTEDEKTALMNDIYDAALVKLARAGLTLDDFVLSKIDDVDLANTIIDQSYKLAALSDQNPMKVADDIVFNMEKSASEF